MRPLRCFRAGAQRTFDQLTVCGMNNDPGYRRAVAYVSRVRQCGDEGERIALRRGAVQGQGRFSPYLSRGLVRPEFYSFFFHMGLRLGAKIRIRHDESCTEKVEYA